MSRAREVTSLGKGETHLGYITILKQEVVALLSYVRAHAHSPASQFQTVVHGRFS